VELNGSGYGAIANCGENCIKILIPLVTYFWPREPLSSFQDGFSCLSWIVYVLYQMAPLLTESNGTRCSVLYPGTCDRSVRTIVSAVTRECMYH